MSRFIKLTNRNSYHNGFQFKSGLNIDTTPEPDEISDCCPGFFYFTDVDNFLPWVKFNFFTAEWVWTVTVPENVQVESFAGKYRCKRFILSNQRLLRDFVKEEFSNLNAQKKLLSRLHAPLEFYGAKDLVFPNAWHYLVSTYADFHHAYWHDAINRFFNQVEKLKNPKLSQMLQELGESTDSFHFSKMYHHLMGELHFPDGINYIEDFRVEEKSHNSEAKENEEKS
jgi:hypothetical protein